MKRNYEELFQAGNKAQLEKLQQNGHKKGFDDIDIEYASERIEQEWNELSAEVMLIDTFDDEPDYEAIRHEAADIANFAHMIILKCDKEIAKL